MKEIYSVGHIEDAIEAREHMTFAIAEGQVDPAVRVASSEIEVNKINELESRVKAGEYTIAYGDPEAIPCDCMDCRRQANGQMVIAPKAGGGTTTVVVADALTTNSYRHPGETAPMHKKRVLSELIEAGKKVGGHCADSVPGPEFSGCGAEDKLDSSSPDKPSILEFLQRKGSQIFETLRGLGQEVEPGLETKIISQAGVLRAEGYATTGKELSQAGIDVAGVDSVRILTGSQKAVLVAILTRPDEVLDQTRIAADFGDDYQIFEIAAWSIANGAKATSINPQEEHDKTIAGLAYNLAAGGVIAGPGMRVVVV